MFILEEDSNNMIFIESKSTDPAFNLALEQYVFDHMPKNESYFMLWQNDNAIIVGKHQNTAEEINAAYVKEHGIRVIRRLSGGGAVYHDLGNVNYTFIADAKNLDRLNMQAFCIPVVGALKTMGITAQISGRNDITIDGKKFSGNSQYIKKGRVMHHGTLMFDSDLSVVENALKVNPEKYQSKGLKSVRSRVTNISEYLPEKISLETFKQILRENMISGSDVSVYELTDKDLEEIRRIKKERYDTWEWNYGKSPVYSVRKKEKIDGCGTIELFMEIKNGRIMEIESRGDYFGDGMTEELKARLLDCPLKKEELYAKLKEFPIPVCYAKLSLDAFVELLLS